MEPSAISSQSKSKSNADTLLRDFDVVVESNDDGDAKGVIF